MNEHLTTDRRSFLLLGGVAALAVAGACGTDDDAETAATSTTVAASANDVALLRTASSIEELEVALCQRAIDGGLVKTPAVNDLVQLFLAQHKQHAGVLEGHTTRLSGEPYAQPNPVLLQQFQSRVTDEASLLRALYELAQVSQATLQGAVGSVKDAQLNVVLMSIGGAEARQAAVLGSMTNQPVAAASVAATDKAVAPGTGL